MVFFISGERHLFLSLVQRSGEPDEFPVAQESDWLGIGLLQQQQQSGEKNCTQKDLLFLYVPIGDPLKKRTLMFVFDIPCAA